MTIKLLPYKKEVYRKFIHCLSIFIPIIYYFTTYNTFIYLIVSSTIFTLILNFYHQYYDSIPSLFKVYLSNLLRKYEYKSLWGATYMLIGFSFISFIFEKNIVIISMLVTSIADSCAAIIGIKYGYIRIKNGKSIEGFYIFLICTYLLFFLFINTISLYFLVLISIMIALIELFTPTKYDNITVPIFCSFLLYLFKI